MKNLTLSSFYILTSVLQPIIFASVAYFMFEAGARQGTLLYVALGAGMMGIWSSTLFGSGGAIQWQRWQGVLEYSIAVPPPLLLIIVPLTIATASIGLYSLTATLFWGWLFFDVPLDVAHPGRVPRRPAGDRSSGSGCSASFSPRPSCSTATRTRSRTCSSSRSGS